MSGNEKKRQIRDIRITLTDAQAGALFTGHLRLTKKQAWGFSGRFRLAYDDVRDEAESILAMTIAEWNSDEYSRRYNPAKCSPTSWIYRRLFYGLLTFCMRQQPKETAFTSIPLRADSPSPIDSATVRVPWAEGLLRTLGADARIVVNTLFFGPAELAEEITLITRRSHARIEERAKVAVASFMDWPEDRFCLAWQELQEAL